MLKDMSDSSSPPVELEAELFYPEREVLEFTEVGSVWRSHLGDLFVISIII